MSTASSNARPAGGRKKTACPACPSPAPRPVEGLHAAHPMYQITRAQLVTWLDGLAGGATLLAPRDVSAVILYRPIRSSMEIAWGFRRPALSAKEVFFPPTERLFEIDRSAGDTRLEETLPDGRTIVFGVRPCEARGFRLLDALFLDQAPADPCYARRRENTTLIGLACEELGPTCFCLTVGGTPDSAADVDLMLYPVYDDFLVEVVNEKGRALIPVDGWKPTRVTHQPSALSGQSSLPDRSSWLERFNDDYWKKMGERCLSCRACAYVCPTCRCFIVRDERTEVPGRFERLRCWDACAGENYRRIAGGHRPRPEKGERLRNRFFCKFYYFPEQVGLAGTVACVGCGRCIDVCPVGVDITEIMTDLGRLP